MGTWSNSDHSWNNDDMDSNGRRLTVRNQNGPDDAAWRAVIAESNVQDRYLQALKVVGSTRLENSIEDTYPALKVLGKATFESPSEQMRTEPIVRALGRSEFVNFHQDTDPENPEYALLVTGRASFAHQQQNDITAIKADGDVRIKLGQTTPQPPDPPYDNTCAVLRPQLGLTFGRPDITDIAQYQLLINGNRDDRPNPGQSDAPHVKIGWKDGDRGNVVAIRPRKLLLGSAPWQLVDNDIYRIKAIGSMRIEPEDTANVALKVQGKTWTEHLDATDEDNVLWIAKNNATQLCLGPVNEARSIIISMRGTTIVEGPLQVTNRPGESPSGITASGDITSGGTVNTASADSVAEEGVLELGTFRAAQVIIGRGLHYTIINGLLLVSGSVEMANGLLVSGGNIATNGTVNAGSVHAGAAQVTGNIICDAAITAQHSISTQANALVGGNVECTGAVNAAEFLATGNVSSGGNVTANGTVNGASVHATGNITSNGAITAHGGISTQANLGVGGSIDCEGAVGTSELPVAGSLTVLGESHFDHPAEFQESVTVRGQTEHLNAVRMNGQEIIMGGEGENEVKMFANEGRLDVYIGGELRFYIDRDGGHNA